MTDMDMTMMQEEGSETAVPVAQVEEDSLETALGEEENPYLSEAEGVRAVYPDFDLAAEMNHPVLGSILRGEVAPTLKQLYEATHLDEILEGRVSKAVAERLDSAVTAAVEAALLAHEQKMLDHIRARGQRPSEVGVHAATGIRMHPAVGRLTRRERAMLAQRAQNGETIEF